MRCYTHSCHSVEENCLSVTAFLYLGLGFLIMISILGYACSVCAPFLQRFMQAQPLIFQPQSDNFCLVTSVIETAPSMAFNRSIITCSYWHYKCQKAILLALLTLLNTWAKAEVSNMTQQFNHFPSLGWNFAACRLLGGVKSLASGSLLWYSQSLHALKLYVAFWQLLWTPQEV